MQIYSDSFEENQHIPQKYSCDGRGVSPLLRVTNVPGETVSLALIVDDPDAPGGTFNHWLVWNLPGDTKYIEEGKLPEEARQGANSGGNTDYYPPCPPEGTHRYFFKIYALDIRLDDLEVGADRSRLEQAIDGHVLDQAELIGLYSRE